MIKVFIADDHYYIRRSIKRILSAEKDICVSGEASNPQEIITSSKIIDWDVLILDIIMPNEKGLDLLAEILTKKPNSKVLILTMYKDKEVVEISFKEGASGYLDKENINGELITAVRDVYKGNKYVGIKIKL